MFVLVEDNNFVHLGPIHWAQRMFQSYITDELEISFNVPLVNNNEPIIVNEHFKILPAIVIYPTSHNPKIEQYAGPYWEYTDTQAIGRYNSVLKDISVIKNELRTIIASNRWAREVSGITVVIQGNPLYVSTKREDRDVYANALLHNLVKTWKFGDLWITLSLEELRTITTTIHEHIQAAFDWEQEKHNEINSKNTHDELNNIVLTV